MSEVETVGRELMWSALCKMEGGERLERVFARVEFI